MNFEEITQFEKKYLNTLLELKIKEYDEYFKNLCKRYDATNPIWKKNVDKLEAKLNFILKLREKLGFTRFTDQLSLQEAREAINNFETPEVEE